MGNEKKQAVSGRNPEYVDVFVYGKIGSGKDTVADFLKSYYGTRKMRLAGTIKQVICEELGMTFEQLEEAKRANPEIRKKHHEWSLKLAQDDGSLIRTAQIARHESFDLNIVDDPERPIVVCDVTMLEQAVILLDNNWVGIFLDRTTDEFRDAAHVTEKNLFKNGQLIELSKTLDYGERMLVVFNDEKSTRDERVALQQSLDKNVEICLPVKGCTAPQLLEAIDMKVSKWLN
jgi:hypothetical protein